MKKKQNDSLYKLARTALEKIESDKLLIRSDGMRSEDILKELLKRTAMVATATTPAPTQGTASTTATKPTAGAAKPAGATATPAANAAPAQAAPVAAKPGPSLLAEGALLRALLKDDESPTGATGAGGTTGAERAKKIDYQASYKLAQSVASITLAMLDDMEERE